MSELNLRNSPQAASPSDETRTTSCSTSFFSFMIFRRHSADDGTIAARAASLRRRSASGSDQDGFLISSPGARQQSCRSEEHTSELQSLMRISYAVFCLKKKKQSQESNKDKNESQ